MSSNLSSKQLKYVFMMISLSLRLKEDLSLDLSLTKVYQSLLKCHINHCVIFFHIIHILLFCFHFCRVYFIGTNIKSLDGNKFSEERDFFLTDFLYFLIIYNLINYNRLLTLFRMGGGTQNASQPLTWFFSVTSTNVRISL